MPDDTFDEIVGERLLSCISLLESLFRPSYPILLSPLLWHHFSGCRAVLGKTEAQTLTLLPNSAYEEEFDRRAARIPFQSSTDD